MTDYEVRETLELFRQRPELRAFVRELSRIADDSVLMKTVELMLDAFGKGQDEAEVKAQAAAFLREHGRPKAADRILNT